MDKRSSHLSSMIALGKMTREEDMKEPESLYDDISIIKKRHGLTNKAFDELLASLAHEHSDHITNKKSLWFKKNY